MTAFDVELRTAIAAVTAAGDLCRSAQPRVHDGRMTKDDRSPVTIADFGAQALVCRALEAAFPADPVVGEEDASALRSDEAAPIREQVVRAVRAQVGDVSESAVLDWIDRGGHPGGAARFWTLDPIDGTKGFLRGDQYAVSLALVVDGRLQVAAVCCPNYATAAGTGVVLWAVRGGGAFASAAGGPAVPIRVSTEADIRRLRSCESVEKAHSSQSDAARIRALLHIEAEPVRIDSQAKYAAVAQGHAELYLRLPKNATYREKIWDHAGGTLVVHEAGGTVTDIHGRPLDFSLGRTLDNNRGVVVSHGLHHAPVIDAIAQLEIGT